MHLVSILGAYTFGDGVLSSDGVAFTLHILPCTPKNVYSPSLQLVYREQGHELNNKRLSGLFKLDENIYKGDIRNGNLKEIFIIDVNRVLHTASISRVDGKLRKYDKAK